jgi:hypothetical protein
MQGRDGYTFHNDNEAGMSATNHASPGKLSPHPPRTPGKTGGPMGSCAADGIQKSMQDMHLKDALLSSPGSQKPPTQYLVLRVRISPYDAGASR